MRSVPRIFDPWLGTRMATAWASALELLADREWIPSYQLRRTMAAAGALHPRTVSTILREAKRAGVIVFKGQYDFGRKLDHREVKLIAHEESYWLSDVELTKARKV